MLELLALTLVLAAPAAPAAPLDMPVTTRTPVVIVLEHGKLPKLAAMQTWFLKDGQPQPVLSVEKGPAEVVVVRDPAVQPVLDILAKALIDSKMLDARLIDHLPGPRDRAARSWDPRILQHKADAFVDGARDFFLLRKNVPEAAIAVARGALRKRCRLGAGAQLRFISPRAAPVSRTVNSMNIFNLSTRFKAEYHAFLTFVERVPTQAFGLRLGDAVWLAGKELHEAGRRRAVLVLLDGKSRDGSLYATESVHEVLQELQVPVFAWSFRAGDLTAAWNGEPVIHEDESFDPQATLARFDSACEKLQRNLAAQRVVWIEGYHPTWTIQLSADAEGVRLAGNSPVVLEPPLPAADEGSTP